MDGSILLLLSNLISTEHRHNFRIMKDRTLFFLICLTLGLTVSRKKDKEEVAAPPHPQITTVVMTDYHFN
jgi:hypothetical protein